MSEPKKKTADETRAADLLAERCPVCSYSTEAHREQDPAKRRFAICDRGLPGKPTL